MSTYLDLEDKIKDFLEEKLNKKGAIHISSLTPLSKGWETDLFAFKINLDEQQIIDSDNLIIRIFPSFIWKKRVKWEYDVLLALHHAGYPVPKVYFFEIKDNKLGKPFIIMERIIGQDQGELFFSLLKENKTQQIITEIFPIFSKLFVALHKLDWKILPVSFEENELSDSYYFVNKQLSFYEKEIKKHGFSSLLPIYNWLEEKKENSSCSKISIIHRDFHPHNIIISEHKKAYVIDWAGSSVGDSRNDLAWTLMLVRAYTNQEIRDEILNFYEQEYGSKIMHIEFFEVLAVLRRFLDVMSILQKGPETIGMRAESIDQIKETAFHLENIFNLLVDRTGLKLPELKKWIVSL